MYVIEHIKSLFINILKTTKRKIKKKLECIQSRPRPRLLLFCINILLLAAFLGPGALLLGRLFVAFLPYNISID